VDQDDPPDVRVKLDLLVGFCEVNDASGDFLPSLVNTMIGALVRLAD
jgi:hypothetical protein